ncbi:hypothetical protein LDENG_00233330 [Lucifuga dentata]|nr:hypothetical protein LDENG_00233330 [Lucifuga dentata]
MAKTFVLRKQGWLFWAKEITSQLRGSGSSREERTATFKLSVGFTVCVGNKRTLLKNRRKRISLQLEIL